MKQTALVQAILADLEDDTPRLVFADWLEHHGQAARAAWIRMSCHADRLEGNDPARYDLYAQEQDAFRQCRPLWLQPVTGVLPSRHRGMLRLTARSKAAVMWLGKVGWLDEAVADGWLEGIVVVGCSDPMVQVMARWKAAAREVPLFARLPPQVSDEALAFLLEVPHLWSLHLPGYALRNPSIRRLGQRADLRWLALDGVRSTDEARTVFEQMGQLRGLKRLTISGFNNQRPTDEDLELLGDLSGLQTLYLGYCHAITDKGLVPLQRLRGLQKLTISNCAGVSEAGVAALRQALPTVHVDHH